MTHFGFVLFLLKPNRNYELELELGGLVTVVFVFLYYFFFRKKPSAFLIFSSQLKVIHLHSINSIIFAVAF